MRTLLIDDLRVFDPARSTVVVARTSNDALSVLRRAAATGEPWREIWLDHDLGDATGRIDDVMPVIGWMCEQAFNDAPVPVGTVYVHTSNNAAATDMVRTLTKYGYTVRRVNASEHFAIDADLHAQALARTPESTPGQEHRA